MKKVVGGITGIIVFSLILLLINFFFRPFEDVYTLEYEAPLPVQSTVLSDQAVSLEEELILTMKKRREILNVPSISIAAGVKGEIIWNGSTGYSDLASKKLVDSDTIYRVGSVSKMITASAAARFLGKDFVLLDESISEYMWNIPPNGKNITLRQLLSHMSGIRHYQFELMPPFLEYWSNKEYDSVSSSLYKFIDDPLLFEPGDDFHYSSYGYSLASLALETLSETDFRSLVSEQVFTPLKMNDSMAEDKYSQTSRIATFYDIVHPSHSAIVAREVNNTNKWAGGGFLSTPSDLVKLGQAWFDESFISKKTRNEFFTVQKLNSGVENPQGYGLGWRIGQTKKVFNNDQTIRVIHHGGTAQGSSALLIIYPEYDLTVAIAVNSNVYRFGEMFDTAHALARVLIQGNKEFDDNE